MAHKWLWFDDGKFDQKGDKKLSHGQRFVTK